jgi:hypothetical protein
MTSPHNPDDSLLDFYFGYTSGELSALLDSVTFEQFIEAASARNVSTEELLATLP